MRAQFSQPRVFYILVTPPQSFSLRSNDRGSPRRFAPRLAGAPLEITTFTVCFQRPYERERKNKQKKWKKRKTKEKKEKWWCRVCLALCLQQLVCSYNSSWIFSWLVQSSGGWRKNEIFKIIKTTPFLRLVNKNWITLRILQSSLFWHSHVPEF